ncbi:MAG: response regulator, partial [Rhodospirillaceae bacterium]
IQALAATHKLLSCSRWEGASLREIVDAEMAPYRSNGSERVVTDGPQVMLRPPTAQSVALALHELATNAAKYGALSTHGGNLRVVWGVEHDVLTLHWTERGGPTTCSPSSLGFGLKIVRSGIEEQLDGCVVYDWRHEGLHCVLSIPAAHLVKVVQDPVRPETPTNSKLNGHAYSGLVGKRILVVEDEHLISMLVREMLAELGVGVVGPVNTLNDGFAAVQSEFLDGAILDLNLRGQQTYALAEVLTRRGVPFVFMTGYDSDTVDGRYLHIPVLQKPIEFDILKRTLASSLIKQVA